ncbi:MAG: ferredoxin Fer [Haloglomus sp.]
MASPFEILGVEPDADDGAVVDAYRERVKETHPDQGGSIEAFRAVQEAYERIQDGYEPGDSATGTGDDWRPDTAVDDDADDPEVESRVEYLNYEVLDDHGWELTDDDLFEKAAAAGLDPEDYGEFVVGPDQTVLEAAEACGFTWPFACRGGACSNCAMAVCEGDVPPPASHVLPPEIVDRGIRLSCSVTPTSDEAKVVYNVKHLPGVDELLLPATRFEKATSD